MIVVKVRQELRTSTTTIQAQYSLPDLNYDHTHPVFPAGPQPRVSTPSVPGRISTARIYAQYSLPELNRDIPAQAENTVNRGSQLDEDNEDNEDDEEDKEGEEEEDEAGGGTRKRKAEAEAEVKGRR